MLSTDIILVGPMYYIYKGHKRSSSLVRRLANFILCTEYTYLVLKDCTCFMRSGVLQQSPASELNAIQVYQCFTNLHNF